MSHKQVKIYIPKFTSFSNSLGSGIYSLPGNPVLWLREEQKNDAGFQHMNLPLPSSAVSLVLIYHHCGGLAFAGHQVPTKVLCHSPPQQEDERRK